MTVPNMTEEAAEAIMVGRQGLDGETLRTTARPLTTETIDAVGRRYPGMDMTPYTNALR